MDKKLRQATICLLRKNDEVLLAMKKRGFGVGKWNGEIGVTPVAIEQVAVLDFRFPDVPAEKNWDQQVVVFICNEWTGEFAESEEMLPKWFKISEIPYDQMWSDDVFWMPKVFSGQKVKAEFIFSGEGKLKEHKFKELV